MTFTDHKKKWGLFFVLAGSLGFNLSMNPEHFNNIARNEKFPIHSLDLAQQAAPQEVKGKARETLVSGAKGSFKAKVYSIDTSTFVRFENLDSSVEGKSCELCGKSFVLNSNFTNIEDVQKELLGLANGKQTEGKDGEEKPVVQKKGEATEVDLEVWAAKCDKASDSSKLNCHKNRLVELSKYLKNSIDNSNLVAEYFNEYMKSDLLTAFTSPTVKSDFSMGGFGSQSGFEVDSSMLEEANDLSESIISGLQSRNGKKTIELITKMRAASHTAQLRHSQQLMLQGKAENNMAKWQMGFLAMQPETQKQILRSSTQSMLSAVESMQGSASDKSYYSQYVTQNMYTPVDNILNQLKESIMNGNTNAQAGVGGGSPFSTQPQGQTTSNLSGLETFIIPGLGESTAVINPQIINTDINAMINQRQGDQVRGSGITVLWGAGDVNRFAQQQQQQLNPPAVREGSVRR